MQANLVITNENRVIVQVPIVDDNVAEGDEMFTVHLMLLSQPGSIQIEMNITEVSVTIHDDDSEFISFIHRKWASFIAFLNTSHSLLCVITIFMSHIERLYHHCRYFNWTDRNPEPCQ